jgi:hypothetical protein
VGWKMFYVTASAIVRSSCDFLVYLLLYLILQVLVAYTVALRCSRAAKDPSSGKLLRSTLEQRWIWALLLLSFFFNDPSFIQQASNV